MDHVLVVDGKTLLSSILSCAEFLYRVPLYSPSGSTLDPSEASKCFLLCLNICEIHDFHVQFKHFWIKLEFSPPPGCAQNYNGRVKEVFTCNILNFLS